MKRILFKRLKYRKIGQKVLLAIALFILLWSRVLSGVAAIQEVEATYPDIQVRGAVTVPEVTLADETVASHIAVQEEMSGHKDVKLQELTERSRKARRIREFYARWNAPMADNAEFIVDTSEKYGIDWRLIPAISIVESTGGRYCFRSYNSFGWGKMSFSSFEEAIDTVARGLANGYGTSNPYAIAPRYNPVTPNEWANKVSGLMSQI
jgi:hypothetical protein